MARLRTTGITSWEAIALAELGDARLITGNVADAVPLLDEALALHRRIAFPLDIAVTFGERAHAARMQGDQVLATRLFAESIAVAAEINSERALLGAVAGLAGVALALGQPERAVRILSAVEATRVANGVDAIAHGAHAARILVEVRANLPESVIATSWTEGRHLPFTDALAGALAMTSTSDAPSSPGVCDTSCGLTPRELEVLRLLVEGYPDRQISETLFIGTHTVQTHVANLFAKLGVNSRAEAAAVAVRHSLV